MAAIDLHDPTRLAGTIMMPIVCGALIGASVATRRRGSSRGRVTWALASAAATIVFAGMWFGMLASGR